MTIYFIFIVLCLIFAFVFDRQDEKSKFEQFAFWSLCLYLICLSGFSYGLGGDKFSYMQDFVELPLDISILTYVKEQFLEQTYMPLWSIINYLCKEWFDSFYVVQFIESIVVNVSICYVARKYTNHHFLFLILFFVSEIFFQFNTEVMREGFAIAIGLIIIYKYEQKQNIIRYLIGVAIALLFHLSAIILILYPLFAKIRVVVSKKNFAIFCISVVAVWAVSDLVVTDLMPHLPIISESVKLKVLSYMGIGTTIFGFGNLFCRYIILPFIVGSYFLRYNADDGLIHTSAKHILLFELAIGGLICVVGFGFVRFFNYVRIINLCWLTILVANYFREQKHLLARTFVILLYSLFSFLQWNTYFPDTKAHFYDLFVPYTSIVNEDSWVFEREYIYEEAITSIEGNKAQREIK